MVTVLREGGFRFAIHANDHGPPHVHAYGRGGMTRILIGGPTHRPLVVSVAGMMNRDARDARRIVDENRGRLMLAWRRMHGD
jgi:hypothetical protein